MSTQTRPDAARPPGSAEPRPNSAETGFRELHIARWGSRRHGSPTTPLVVQGVVGLVALSHYGAYRFARAMGAPPLVVAGLAGAVGLGLLAFGTVWAVRWYRRNQKIGGADWKPDPACRVQLICHPERARSMVPRSRDGFEPVVVFAWLAVPPPRAAGYIWAAVSLLAFAACALMFGTEPLKRGIGYYAVAGCVGLGGIAAALATPTYFRVVPGRLDVMRFNFFRSRKPSLASYDLRASRVLVDLEARFIAVDSPDAPPVLTRPSALGRQYEIPGPGSVAISLLFLPGASELGRAVLAGALSAASTPLLPEDELVG